VTVWADERWPWMQLFTGDDKPDVARRALAVEPMTCPPNAFRTGTGVIRLEPGETFTGRWGIADG
jgi:aldose 1-epimerase